MFCSWMESKVVHNCHCRLYLGREIHRDTNGPSMLVLLNRSKACHSHSSYCPSNDPSNNLHLYSKTYPVRFSYRCECILCIFLHFNTIIRGSLLWVVCWLLLRRTPLQMVLTLGWSNCLKFKVEFHAFWRDFQQILLLLHSC